MSDKTFPIDQSTLHGIIREYPTPFYLYDERGIRENARRLKAAFAWCAGFREFFAVKATPNPHILKIMRDEGFGGDCSSLAELVLCERVGIVGEQLFAGYQILKEKGVRRFGLHTMVASNELDPDFFIETARMVFDLSVELAEQIDVRLEFVNLGGGIGIPYRPDEQPVDLQQVGSGVQAAYEELIVPAGLDPLKVFMENGRVMTGPYGWLVTTAIHEKHIYKDYVGVDACMANLMRPGMYGAYHHITVLGRENAPHDHTVDVVGSLCENNDKFAIDRSLPKVEMGDILIIHDAGAHGHSMGFQYNGKLRSAELLLKEDGSIQQIRRAETLEDYFATLDLSEL